MPAWVRKTKQPKRVKSKNSQEVLDRLQEFLENNCDEPVQILCGFWEDQQNAISYQEIRQAVIDGVLCKEALKLWSQDYSVLVTKHLNDMWLDAIEAGATTGQPLLDNIVYGYIQTPHVLNWVNQHGAEFVTSCAEEQKKAISALLTKKMRDSHTVDELSRMIRPCIGLTEGQAKANAKYYDNIVNTLKENHPRMKPESIQKKALEASQKYAERQHRQRAMTIAQTESAYAYNQGADEATRQAQSQNLLGTVVKRWSTSGDDRVCSICSALDGVEVDMDKGFSIKGKELFPGQHMMPPAHPRCACAIEYIEVEPPVVTDTVTTTFEALTAENVQLYNAIAIDDSDIRTEKRNDVDISTKKVLSANNNIYVSDNVKLKGRQLHEIDTGISQALKKLNIDPADNIPTTVIISMAEMQTGALAAYNAYKNVLYVNEYAGNRKLLLESQESFASNKSDISTYVHELIHWLDAERYRKLHGEIDEKYITWLREWCRKKLDKLWKSGYNIREISTYATDKLMDGHFDETYTEYRVKQLLGE